MAHLVEPPPAAPGAGLAQLADRLHPYRRVLAAVLAGCAALLGVAALRQQPAGVAVVTASRGLVAGSVLDPGDLRLSDLPAAAVPQGALRGVGAADGRVLGAALGAGEPITRVQLQVPVRVPAGKVALPVHPADAAVLGLLGPGATVDVLATAAGGDGAGAGAGAGAANGRVVAARVEVLATLAGGSVTLALTPGQAAAVAAQPSVSLAAGG